MNSWLPKWYKQWVSRVSNIVEFVYPFDWNSEERFLSWLDWKGIKQKDYMNIATTWWTEIHKVMEEYMNWRKYISPLYNQIKEEIEWGKKWIDELNEKYKNIKYLTELVLLEKNNLYQGTIDLVRVNKKKQARLYDFKSWEITKKAFNLEQRLNKNWTPPKPTEKLKKLKLQLKAYARILEQQGYEIMGFYGVWLHSSGCYEYEIEIMSDEEFDNILSSFFIRNTNIPPNFNIKIIEMAKIEIQTVIPDQLYSKASIVLEENDFEWLTYEEKIVEGIKLQKYLLKQYTEWKL